jgi:hypothetical protein
MSGLTGPSIADLSGATSSHELSEPGALLARILNALQSLAYVPVEPFRARFLELERRQATSRTELARQLGWYRSVPPSQRRHRRDARAPDTGRVSRVLGLTPAAEKRAIKYELAVAFCGALGLDPWEAGV